jgi:hypothetical protein
VIRISVEGGATSKIGEARFGKCRLTITPPEEEFSEKKKISGRGPTGPPNNVATKEARVVCVLTESKLLKDGFDLDLPVLRATVEAIKCQFQQPIFILLSVWITNRGFDNSNFIRR